MSIKKPAAGCPVCGAHGLHIFQSAYDDRYGYPGTFPLQRCSVCRHVHLQVSFSPESMRDLYSSYYPRSVFNVEDHRPHKEISGFKAWFDGVKSSTFRWVPGNVRVLDIGCGFGESLGYHLARGCDVYGVEADENIRRVADRYGYKVHVGLFDPDAYEEDYFDYVTMDQVIEHVSDPVQTVKGIERVLKPGGLAILSTPNAQGWGARLFKSRWIHWHAPYHQQFFSMESMRITAEKAGFEFVESRTITNSAWLHYQWMHLLTIPVPGKPSMFWSAGGRVGIARRTLIKGFKIVNRLKINHIITRFFDLIGVGDNRVYFLRKI